MAQDLDINLRLESSNCKDYFISEHLKSNLKTRALQGASAIIIAQICTFCIGIIGTIILARLLTPDDFGLIAMALSFSLLLQNFGVNGFTEAIIQRPEINHKQISTLFWINASISLGLTLFFIASSPVIALFYKEPRLKLIISVISLSILFAGLSTQHLALLKRNMQFHKTSANTVGASFISITVAITLAFWGWGYWALVARWVMLPLLTTIGAWILCRWRPGLPARGTGVWPMLKFAINTYGNFIMDYFRRYIDKIFLGRFYGTQSLGHYDRAYQLSNMLPNQLVHPMTSVAVATLSRLSDNPAKYRHNYLEVISLLAFVGMPISAILTLTGNDLILFLLGPQWVIAGKIFAIFGVSIGVMLIYFTHGWLHLSLGTPDRWFRWGVIALIVTVLCFIVGLPFGVIGIATAYSTSFYILVGPGLWYAGRPIQLKLSSIVSVVWKYYLSALAAGLLCWFIFYAHSATSYFFMGFNVLTRISISIILCLSIYIILIIISYRSIDPIFYFISILREMIPNNSTDK